MRSRSLLIARFALITAGLTACQEDATGPSPTVEPDPTSPNLAVASNSWIVRAKMPSSWTGVAPVPVGQDVGGEGVGVGVDPPVEPIAPEICGPPSDVESIGTRHT